MQRVCQNPGVLDSAAFQFQPMAICLKNNQQKIAVQNLGMIECGPKRQVIRCAFRQVKHMRAAALDHNVMADDDPIQFRNRAVAVEAGRGLYQPVVVECKLA